MWHSLVCSPPSLPVNSLYVWNSYFNIDNLVHRATAVHELPVFTNTHVLSRRFNNLLCLDWCFRRFTPKILHFNVNLQGHWTEAHKICMMSLRHHSVIFVKQLHDCPICCIPENLLNISPVKTEIIGVKEIIINKKERN